MSGRKNTHTFSTLNIFIFISEIIIEHFKTLCLTKLSLSQKRTNCHVVIQDFARFYKVMFQIKIKG